MSSDASSPALVWVSPHLEAKHLNQDDLFILVDPEIEDPKKGIDLCLFSSKDFSGENKVQSLLQTSQMSILVYGGEDDPCLASLDWMPFSKVISEKEFKKLSIAEHFSKDLNRMKKQQLLKQTLTSNYHQLEELTQGLEDLVDRETEREDSAKKEVQDSLKGLRRLVQLTTSLGEAVTLEDVVARLNKDIRQTKFSISQFILGFPFRSRYELIGLMKGRVQRIRLEEGQGPTSIRIKQNDPEDQRFLANQFQRPFVHVLTLPLRLASQGAQPVTLFVEHQLEVGQTDTFLEEISPWLQPLSMTIERLLLESEMHEASYLWERTFDSVEDPLCIVTSDYELLRSNVHFSDPQQAGTKCYESFANRTSPCEGCRIHEVIQAGQPQTMKVRRAGKAFEMTSYPVYLGPPSEVSTLVNHYLDVTDKEDLRGQTIQNEKMAALGHLAGHIAHELNNPLTGIRSLSQILMSEVPEDSEIYSDLKEVEIAASRSQSIITDLLSFADDRGKPEDELIDVNDLIESTLSLLKVSLHNHKVDINLEDSQLHVRAQKSLLQQVLFNLINNSCQAMDDPGQIQISTKEQDGNVTIKVRDTGPGIPKKIRDQIFLPFFTTKERGRGTGLGLSMSREIVERYGGKLRFDSSEGQGTTFEVVLPKEPI